ncbi:MAG: hypothetical protein C5S40_01755 [ANME-2 cluster archaeon]|nr:hypothetical protein [ANME-2 cluster archaeon]
MNVSVTPTDRLKLVNTLGSCFAVIKSTISGWSTLSMPILAPLRRPPCLMAWVAASNTFINDTGPLAIPPVLPTISPCGRSLLKLKPVPPPLWCMMAALFSVPNISSRESPTGRTKQAASCLMRVPAFIRVGELGRNLRFDMTE